MGSNAEKSLKVAVSACYRINQTARQYCVNMEEFNAFYGKLTKTKSIKYMTESIAKEQGVSKVDSKRKVVLNEELNHARKGTVELNDNSDQNNCTALTLIDATLDFLQRSYFTV